MRHFLPLLLICFSVFVSPPVDASVMTATTSGLTNDVTLELMDPANGQQPDLYDKSDGGIDSGNSNDETFGNAPSGMTESSPAQERRQPSGRCSLLNYRLAPTPFLARLLKPS